MHMYFIYTSHCLYTVCHAKINIGLLCFTARTKIAKTQEQTEQRLNTFYFALYLFHEIGLQMLQYIVQYLDNAFSWLKY